MMTDSPALPERTDAKKPPLSPFGEKLLAFVLSRRIEYHDRISARMPGVSPELAESMFNSMQRALDKVTPTLEGRSAKEKDEAVIATLQPIFGSKELAYGARQYNKLLKLQDSLVTLDGEFNRQIEILIGDRTIGEHGRVRVESLVAELALDMVKTLFPTREGVREMDTYRDLRRIEHDLTVTLTESAGPNSPRASDAVRAFEHAITDKVCQLTGLSSNRLQR